MSHTKTLLSGGHAWIDSIPEVPEETTIADPFAVLAAKGLPDELVIQLTFAGADKLGLEFKERDETALAAQRNDPQKQGFEVYAREHGVRFDLFLTELEANGFKFVGAHAFHNPKRPDPTASITFSRRAGDEAVRMPPNVRELLTSNRFNGMFLHANIRESGTRRDCINCSLANGRVNREFQLAFDGPAKGNYYLHKVSQIPVDKGNTSAP